MSGLSLHNTLGEDFPTFTLLSNHEIMEAVLKQPELGQTITRLRQEKQLTQEELVEMCNLNVRTLQRIEAGEVTPRDYTLRSLFNALEYDIEAVVGKVQRRSAIGRLQIAWIAGGVYFILGLFELVVDYIRFEEEITVYFSLIYTAVKILAGVSFVFFMIGFFEVGKQFKSSLLSISSFLMMGSLSVILLYDVISIFSDMTSEEFIMTKGAEAILFGGIDILFGIALFRMGDRLGVSARAAGTFEIISGALFLTVILAFLGTFTLLAANLLEVVLLYKCYTMISEEENM